MRNRQRAAVSLALTSWRMTNLWSLISLQAQKRGNWPLSKTCIYNNNKCSSNSSSSNNSYNIKVWWLRWPLNSNNWCNLKWLLTNKCSNNTKLLWCSNSNNNFSSNKNCHRKKQMEVHQPPPLMNQLQKNQKLIRNSLCKLRVLLKLGCSLLWTNNINRDSKYSNSRLWTKWTHYFSNSRWFRICNIDSLTTVEVNIGKIKTNRTRKKTTKRGTTNQRLATLLSPTKLSTILSFSRNSQWSFPWSKSKKVVIQTQRRKNNMWLSSTRSSRA